LTTFTEKPFQFVAIPIYRGDQTFLPTDRTRPNDSPAAALTNHLHPGVLKAEEGPAGVDSHDAVPIADASFKAKVYK
jgi:hypothetical protein